MRALTYYFRRIGELGFAESVNQSKELLYQRVISRSQAAYDRLFSSDITVSAVLQRTGFTTAEELASHLKTRTSPRFFLDRNPAFYREALSTHFPGQAEALITAADLVMQRKFDLLGSGLTDLGSIPRSTGYLPWQMDFKSGTGWDPGTHYKNIRYRDRPGVDVKVPWELSRFQHLLPLGQAYCLTGQERYAGEFVRQVSDWIATNPCRYGVNWACTMDVGIRAVNWIWGFYLFRQSPSVHEEFVLNLLQSLSSHAQFIRSNLEYRTVRMDGAERRLNSNHYLSNIVGLLYIAVMFPELRLRDEAEFAKNELATELFEQTYTDGADYEHSTFYHRLVSELFLSGFLLLKRNGHVLESAVQERLQKMARYVADYSRPDGLAPQIGDADNGRLHPLSVRSIGDHSYIPVLVAEEFGRSDLKIKSADPEVLWWIGRCPTNDSAGEKLDQPPQLGIKQHSAAYGNEQFFILRGNQSYAFVSAARVGMRGFGSHSHNDLLSFEYWAHDQAWIVDPGTYIYTPDPEARNLFRSTQSHNTVRVDGEEINPLYPNQLFQMSDAARVTLHEWAPGAEQDHLDLEHTGYIRLSEPVRHRRRFALDKPTGKLAIEDSFLGSGEHAFEWFFHLAPEVEVERSGHDFMMRAGDHKALLNLGRVDCDVEIQTGWYSPSYGIRQQASVIVGRLKGTPPLSLTVTISAEMPAGAVNDRMLPKTTP